MPGKIIGPQDTMNFPEGGYKTFKIGDLFDIRPTKAYKLTNDGLFSNKGEVPVVSNSSVNNGIGGYVGLNPTEKGNMITYSDTTTSDAIFYQPFDFVGYPHVQGLYPKQNGWSEKSLLYFISAFKKAAGGKFDYANKFNRTIAAQLEVVLPANKAGSPDLDFMCSRIRELEEERIRELEAYIKACGFENTEPTPPEISALQKMETNSITYKEYRILDIFTVQNSHSILKTDVVFNSGTTPYVTAGVANNSIASYITYDRDLVERGNSIMIGGKTMVITYQPQDFYSNDSHNLVLNLRVTEPTENTSLFLVSSLLKSLSHKYHWGDSISKAKIKADSVMVPINDEGHIDFPFMENLINGVKKKVISTVKDFMQKERNAYCNVVH